MEIILEHKFIIRCHDLKGLLKDCHKLNTYCGRLEKQSLLYPNRYDPNKYKGDGFELLIEALIKLSPIDNRIGISNYKIVEEGCDTGVDGFGIGIDGNNATVQIKYRSNSGGLLTANTDMLGNFVSASLLKYEVNPKSKVSMLIFTNAEGLHYYTDNEMYENKVRCIGYSDLRRLLDNNIIFWNTFRNLLNL